ncbi:alpha/beta fold hydrolase [Prauserella muralis]|uniref:2-hydroxy-6-oxo-2,4-heptadienoate hydrolase n=1 Tax=Prauserella muralis TaxID=588067 RepID=A0A2V4ABL5_9PSEU|nr:alpha/beta hydrolase [Prauserella muralis]PXY16516.1 2-hydroxy-6-oxo-2,4-heptadienoate hydrolase [Prauserella muralis]TWE11106.1 2-hydroxymuconate semialdehyde hydrolase [Prauserella muralis]
MTTTASEVGVSKYVDVRGVRTHYHDAGTGDPVLLLHGSGPGVSAWANWRLTLPVLAERFRVLAADIVGFGHTERPADVCYSLRTWTNHVWGFADAMGLERFSVIGNSLGGRIGLEMAADRPERIARMVLMGSPGVGMTATEGLKAVRAYEPSHDNMRTLLKSWFAVDPDLITEDLVRDRYEASVAPGAHEAYTAMFNDPRHAGGQLGITEEQVRATTPPALLVHGREDRVIPAEISWTMVDLLPNADLHVFARCGHWTQIERADEFNTVVGDYLAA